MFVIKKNKPSPIGVDIIIFFMNSCIMSTLSYCNGTPIINVSSISVYIFLKLRFKQYFEPKRINFLIYN